MKKSLIALLVAAMPAAAFADVTIYGAIKAGVENLDKGGNTTKVTNIDDLGSRIGFKGSEDLGNGLKTIWQVETGFNIDGTAGTGSHSGTFANRNSFLGLQGGFGTVRFGNVSNFLDSDMGVVDTWTYNSSILGLGTFTRDGDRLKNSVRYDLPSVVPGLTAALQYGAKETRGAATPSDRESTILGLGYENSGFFGKYAYVHEAPKAAAGVNTDKHQLEVGYNANNLFVGLGYKQSKGDDASYQGDYTAKDTKAVEYALTANYTFGAITPKFTYAHGDNLKVAGVTKDNTGYDQYLLGADYALSKRTTVGAQYGQLKFKGADTQKALGLNMVHTF
ncbi:porin [Chromobacterium paludis]|uniref:Porin n=1 Tax=Chromobacterium paludis TaxID=2605945 RepID=A0A5C1DJK5_9NEIS|nr:porin [Chromobacterium paludis]QEL56149.1 porin [Chromobacterium paludis]